MWGGEHNSRRHKGTNWAERILRNWFTLADYSPDGSSPPRYALASTGWDDRDGHGFGEISRCCGSTMQGTVCSRPRVRTASSTLRQAIRHGCGRARREARIFCRSLLGEGRFSHPRAHREIADGLPTHSGHRANAHALSSANCLRRESSSGSSWTFCATQSYCWNPIPKNCRALARDVADQLPRFLAFTEELALIGGWTMEQVSGVLVYPGESTYQSPDYGPRR